jgi:hypothetical protein
MDGKEQTEEIEIDLPDCDEEVSDISAEEAQKLLDASLRNGDCMLAPADDVLLQIKETFAPARAAQKPNIDNLDDAIVDVENHGIVLLPQPGEGLIIQYPQAWRDTTYYTIHDINYETGTVWLWNPQRKQWASTNFIDAKQHGLVFKVPPEGASELRMAIALGQRKRGRPRKNPLEQAIAPVKEKSDRGRGRPKGTKNRPKEIIEAEKRARREEKNQRALARSAKRRTRV